MIMKTFLKSLDDYEKKLKQNLEWLWIFFKKSLDDYDWKNKKAWMIMIKKNKKAWMIVTKVFFPHKLSFFPHPGYNEDFQDDLNLVKMCENLKQSKWSAQYFSY